MILHKEIKDHIFQNFEESGIPLGEFEFKLDPDSFNQATSIKIIHGKSGKFFQVSALDENSINILFQRIYRSKNAGSTLTRGAQGREVFLARSINTIGGYLESWLTEIKNEYYTPSRFAEYLFKNAPESERKSHVDQIDSKIISRLTKVEEEIKKIPGLHEHTINRFEEGNQEIKKLILSEGSKTLIYSALLGNLFQIANEIGFLLGDYLKSSEIFYMLHDYVMGISSILPAIPL